MTIANLRRRLDRIQARSTTGRITVLANLAAYPPEIVADAIRDWRQWVADGRATRCRSTLYLLPRRLTVAEWSASVAHRREGLH